MLYFLAHALYKAGLFLVAGAIDHGTGTRDITALGGLARTHGADLHRHHHGDRRRCSACRRCSAFFAKEEMYAALALGDVVPLLALVALVLGNALLGAIGAGHPDQALHGRDAADPDRPARGAGGDAGRPASCSGRWAVLLGLFARPDLRELLVASATAGHPRQ